MYQWSNNNDLSSRAALSDSSQNSTARKSTSAGSAWCFTLDQPGFHAVRLSSSPRPLGFGWLSSHVWWHVACSSHPISSCDSIVLRAAGLSPSNLSTQHSKRDGVVGRNSGPPHLCYIHCLPGGPRPMPTSAIRPTSASSIGSVCFIANKHCLVDLWDRNLR